MLSSRVFATSWYKVQFEPNVLENEKTHNCSTSTLAGNHQKSGVEPSYFDLRFANVFVLPSRAYAGEISDIQFVEIQYCWKKIFARYWTHIGR